MHAGLLHLLVPTELDSPPDWQSEFMLSVRSMLHVCSSCLQPWVEHTLIQTPRFYLQAKLTNLCIRSEDKSGYKSCYHY